MESNGASQGSGRQAGLPPRLLSRGTTYPSSQDISSQWQVTCRLLSDSGAEFKMARSSLVGAAGQTMYADDAAFFFVTIPEPLVTISLAASSSSLLSSGLNVMRIPLNTVE